MELGEHTLSVRALDAFGIWTDVMTRSFTIAVAVTDPKESEISIDISTDELLVGDHTLCVRAQGLDGRWSVISSEPFCVDNADGIRTVIFDMPFRMSLNRHSFTINATAGLDRNDCLVELFDVSGKILSSAIWSKSKSSLSLNVNTAGTIVVKVTDLGSKKQLIRQIRSR